MQDRARCRCHERVCNPARLACSWITCRSCVTAVAAATGALTVLAVVLVYGMDWQKQPNDAWLHIFVLSNRAAQLHASVQSTAATVPPGGQLTWWVATTETGRMHAALHRAQPKADFRVLQLSEADLGPLLEWRAFSAIRNLLYWMRSDFVAASWAELQAVDRLIISGDDVNVLSWPDLVQLWRPPLRKDQAIRTRCTSHNRSTTTASPLAWPRVVALLHRQRWRSLGLSNKIAEQSRLEMQAVHDADSVVRWRAVIASAFSAPSIRDAVECFNSSASEQHRTPVTAANISVPYFRTDVAQNLIDERSSRSHGRLRTWQNRRLLGGSQFDELAPEDSAGRGDAQPRVRLLRGMAGKAAVGAVSMAANDAQATSLPVASLPAASLPAASLPAASLPLPLPLPSLPLPVDVLRRRKLNAPIGREPVLPPSLPPPLPLGKQCANTSDTCPCRRGRCECDLYSLVRHVSPAHGPLVDSPLGTGHSGSRRLLFFNEKLSLRLPPSLPGSHRRRASSKTPATPSYALTETPVVTDPVNLPPEEQVGLPATSLGVLPPGYARRLEQVPRLRSSVQLLCFCFCPNEASI